MINRLRASCIRFIPAWAGHGNDNGDPEYWSAVHPRVGGARSGVARFDEAQSGSSPRGRGTATVAGMGLGWRRFIPAWAGHGRMLRDARHDTAVHPRVGGARCRDGGGIDPQHGSSPRGGARQKIGVGSCKSPGSSPRGRGTGQAARLRDRLRRFIPAWAGHGRVGRVYGG